MLLGQLSTQSASPGYDMVGEDPAMHTQAGACARVPFLPLKPLVFYKKSNLLESSPNFLLGFLPRGGSIAPKCAAGLQGVWLGVQVSFLG